MINNLLVAEMVSEVIKTVQTDSDSSMSGFQYVVGYSLLEEKYKVVMDEELKNLIEEGLNCREEVADLIMDTDGFDVVLYTDFAPNYISEEEED